MKKAFITGFLGIAFAFAMVSCNGNTNATDSNNQDTSKKCPKEEQCMKHCEATCPDSACLANKCENCACPDSSACKQKKECCKEEGKGECCKAKGEGCKGDGECKKECEKKK